MRKTLFVLLFLTSTLLAHKLNLFVTHEKNIVDIYAYFASGDACKGCKLSIKNENSIVLKTQLNEEGKFQYPSTFKTLTLIVDASSGHRVEKEITLETITNQPLKMQVQEEKKSEFLKIVLALLGIGLFFYLLKRVKKNAK